MMIKKNHALIAALMAATTLFVAAPAFATAPAFEAATVAKADYAGTIETMASAIERQYPIEEIAYSTAEALRSAAKDGALLAMDQDGFIDAINVVLWNAAHDLHLKVRTEAAIRTRSRASGGRGVPRMRRVRVPAGGGAFGTTKITVEMLDKSTGLVTIDSGIFLNPEIFSNALSALEGADNIIIDLRTVPGGTVQGVQYFTSQFYGKRTHLSSSVSRRFDTPQKFWSVETNVGKKFADKNLYILTSSRTASGAEAISFALKNTDRATLVGEKTAGAGNAGANIEIGGGLMMFLPILQTTHPVTGKPWEGTGVVPHVAVAAEEALEAALKTIAERA